MPLQSGSGRAAFEHNVKAEIAAGKPQKQALAIAYRERGEDADTRADLERLSRSQLLARARSNSLIREAVSQSTPEKELIRLILRYDQRSDDRMSLSGIARDALGAQNGGVATSPTEIGDPARYRKYSGGDTLSGLARDALDNYGAVYQEGPLMWYCTWNGATYGPFASRAAAMEKRMEQQTQGDSLADLVERARGHVREQTGDAKGVLTSKLSKLIDDFKAKKITRKQLENEFIRGGISKADLRWLLDEED